MVYLIDAQLLQTKKNEIKNYLLKNVPDYTLESKSNLEKILQSCGDEGSGVILREVLTDLENSRDKTKIMEEREDANEKALFYEQVNKLLLITFDATFNKLCVKEAWLPILGHVMNSSPLSELNDAWSLFEKHSETITKIVNSMESASKHLPMLKMIKELLNRLSSMQNGALIGRVMLTLADLLALTEESGVNKIGARNEETFLTIENSTDFTGSPDAYDFYKLFWDMQAYFTNKKHEGDRKKIPMPPVLALNSASEFLKFIQGLEKVLTELPKVPILADISSSSSVGSSSRLVSYSATGKLLPLQLSDPVFRRQILTQALFCLREISVYLDYLEKAKRVYLQEVKNKTMKKENWVGFSKYDWIDLDENTNKAPAQSNISKLRTQINVKKDRVIHLLTQTPPHGENYVKIVTDLMNQHERKWEKWKDEERCKTMELSQLKVNTMHLIINLAEKQKQVEAIINSSTYQQRFPGVIQSLSQTNVVSTEGNVRMDSFDVHCEKMKEAIENEVRGPKDDFVYCWRGMRLAGLNEISLCKNLNGLFSEVVMKKMYPDEEEEEEEETMFESDHEEFVFKEEEKEEEVNSNNNNKKQKMSTSQEEEEEEEVEIKQQSENLEETPQEIEMEITNNNKQDEDEGINDEIMFKAELSNNN